MYFPISNLTSLVDSAFVANCILSDSSSYWHRKDSFECFETRTLDSEKRMQIVSVELRMGYFVGIFNESRSSQVGVSAFASANRYILPSSVSLCNLNSTTC